MCVLAGPPGPAKTHIQSVSRAVRLLLLVAQGSDGATATELARGVGIAVPTAYHLLNTLLAEGMLAKDPSRRYVLGPRIGVLSDAVARDLVAPPFLLEPLRTLAEDTGETAYLTAWRRSEITVLACVEGRQALKVAGLFTGFCEHAHARATGKLLLALTSDDLREQYLSTHPLVAVTERTVVDRDRFDRELVRIREQGFATDIEEFADGVACVAVPVTDGSSVIAAYTVAAPRGRFDRRREELAQSALRAARSVAAHARTGGQERDRLRAGARGPAEGARSRRGSAPR